MLLALAGLFVLIWLVSFVVLHVSSLFIHILLLLAVISVVMHVVGGGKQSGV